MAIRAVVFDLDGLLVDSEPLQIAAWDAFLMEYGHRLSPSLLGDMFGLRVWDSAGLLIERLGLPLRVDAVVEARDRIFLDSLAGNLVPMPGARELVGDLARRGIPLGLATSGHRRYVDVVLREIGLEGVFDAEVTGGEVAHGKPAPDIYLAAARALDVPPRLALALEDAPHGVAAARAAGMRCLAIPNAMTRDLPGFDKADAVLDSLAEVMSWLAKQHLLDGARN